MIFKKAILAAGLLSLGICAGAAFAADMNSIQQRQACMKSNGKFMGELAAIMKGEKPYDAAVVTAAFAPMDSACANWEKFWGEDSKPGGATETWAKAEIWTDTEGFKKVGMDAYAAITALRATTDEAGFKAAFPAAGGGCKGCHDKFRRPKEG
jgi:cytochrome c556